MKLFREWALQPNARRGTMLPDERLKDIMRSGDAGYASVYAFSEEDALKIIAAKSSAGLNQYAVYSDTLMIDLDDGDRQLRKTEAVLAPLNAPYDVWSSGGKGYHIGIPLVPAMYGVDVPYSQRKFVESMDVGADLSLYQHGRLLSLPGRLHPKTGRTKNFIRHVRSLMGGKALFIPMISQPAPVFAHKQGEQGELEQGLWQLIALLESEPEPGNRHTKLWSTAKSLADAGLQYDTALDLLTQVNDSWQNPKTELEVTTAVRQAFRR